MIVENEEKAKEQVVLLMETFLNITFCPLVNGNCRSTCICYESAGYNKLDYDKDDERQMVHGPWCGNSMFTGDKA